MKRVFSYILIVTLALVASSCEKALIREPAVSPRSTFEDLWNQMRERYPHFEIKGVDWDAVYDQYSPRIKNSMSQGELFNVLGQMLGEIHDGHVNLMSSFDVSHSPTINEAILGNRNIVESVLYESYLTYTYHTTGGFAHNAIDGNRVGYLMYSSWMNDITKSDLTYLYSLYKDCDGLILDLRTNTGGALYNLRMFLQSLPSQGQLLYSTQVKNGPGYDDFG
ncbi:MAG: hypothetical protein J6Z27_02100, partial [Bacteroidales bacterium]|nr:hypothetical protein [Bacteroidales bacterium]